VILGAVGAAGVALGIGCGKWPSSRTAAAPVASARVTHLLGGIPQRGRFLGSPKAPYTLQYFVDVGCPPSREVTLGPLAAVIRGWVRSGLLRLEFRSVQEGTDSPQAFESQQAAALAAGRQDKLWDYVEYYYQTQVEGLGGEVDTCHVVPGFPRTVARRVPGIDPARWARDAQRAELAGEVALDERAASSAGMRDNTPVYLIGRTGARAIGLAAFERLHPDLDRPLELLRTAVVHL
jgi:hypothetical protein